MDGLFIRPPLRPEGVIASRAKHESMESNTGLGMALMKEPPGSWRWKTALVCVATLVLMTYIDYITGYELIFSAAYLVPVSLCAWFFGRPAVLAMSVAGAAASWLADRLGGHPYSSAAFLYLNSLTCLLICLVTGLTLHRLKRTLEERKQMNQSLQSALEDLKRSTEEIRKLQNGLQVICAWTKQIKVGDKWMTPDEFLRTQLHLKISHGMSPEAERDFRRGASDG